jgi:hypothetical protein
MSQEPARYWEDFRHHIWSVLGPVGATSVTLYVFNTWPPENPMWRYLAYWVLIPTAWIVGLVYPFRSRFQNRWRGFSFGKKISNVAVLVAFITTLGFIVFQFRPIERLRVQTTVQGWGIYNSTVFISTNLLNPCKSRPMVLDFFVHFRVTLPDGSTKEFGGPATPRSVPDTSTGLRIEPLSEVHEQLIVDDMSRLLPSGVSLQDLKPSPDMLLEITDHISGLWTVHPIDWSNPNYIPPRVFGRPKPLMDACT